MIDNQVGGIGVAPGARVWAVRVLDSNLDGTYSQVLCGIDWVAAHAGVIDVANMSFGGSGMDDGNCGLTNRDPIHLAVCATVAKGVTMVTSAGNDFQNAAGAIPGAYSELMAVSAISDSDGMPGGLGGPNCAGVADDVFVPFSNFGSVIDIAAPGVCIVSTNINNTFYRDSGTSFAAPFVSGAAALYKTHHPTASPGTVRQAIIDAREQSTFPDKPALDRRGSYTRSAGPAAGDPRSSPHPDP